MVTGLAMARYPMEEGLSEVHRWDHRALDVPDRNPALGPALPYPTDGVWTAAMIRTFAAAENFTQPVRRSNCALKWLRHSFEREPGISYISSI